jgi:FtsP/CotA-like multicopper oxidase with cupredoxin domain
MKNMSSSKFGDMCIVIALLIAAGVGVLYWQHLKHPSDDQVRRMLPGTWLVSSGDSVHVSVDRTNIIGADGRYASKIANPSTSSVIDLEGTFQVSDGYLIDTMTKCSRTNAHVPNVYRGRIIRADSREMVFAFDGGSSTVYFRKVIP